MRVSATITIALVLTVLFSTSIFAQQVQQTRKYRVIAVKNGDSRVTSMSNETEVTPTLNIYVPNTFTPNGDGINDYFFVQGEAIHSFKIQIFNRWGDLIFESNDVANGWDGKFNGNYVPQGAYVFKLTASSVTGRKAFKEGALNVLY